MSTTVKQFGYGHIFEHANGEEIFVDEDGTSSPILKNEEILDTYIKRFIKDTEWEAEKKEAGKYIFNHPETKGRLLLTLEMDFVDRVCTVSLNGNEFKTFYIDEKNVFGLLYGQMENALAP